MDNACPLKSSDVASCYETVQTSKITDLVIVTVCVALLIIGILASTGVLAIANVASLSYGMYGGAGVLFVVEVMRLICSHKKTEEVVQKPQPFLNEGERIYQETLEREGRVNEQIKTFHIHSSPIQGYNQGRIYVCDFHFIDDEKLKIFLRHSDIGILLRAIDKEKITWDSKSEHIGYHFQTECSEETSEQILIRIRKGTYSTD